MTLKSSAGRSGSGSVVLLVDDQPSFLAALEKLLRRHEFRPISVTNADLALRALDLWPVAAVVSDYLMPGMDGLRLLERVDPRLTRVLLTGYPFDDSSIVRAGIVVLDKGDTIGGLINVLRGNRNA